MEILKEFKIDIKSYFKQDLVNLIVKKIEKKIAFKAKKQITGHLGKAVTDMMDESIHDFIEGVPGQMIRSLLEKLLTPTSEYMLFNQVIVKQVRYLSVDPSGRSGTMLSGLLIIPLGNFGNPNMPIMGYQHGTMLAKKQAPSFFERDDPFATSMEVIIAMLLSALNGYIVALADYQGLGHDRSNIQPYVGAIPLACSVLDLLIATRRHIEACAGVSWNQQIYLIGYSQGGYVTMAAAREMQRNNKYQHLLPHLTAVAPCAGPYSLSGVMRFLMLRQEVYPMGVFFVMTLRGFHAMYGDQFDGIFTKQKSFKPAYWHIWDMADGSVCMLEVNALLPPIPRDMLSDQMIWQLSTKDSPVYNVLRQNDVIDWAPNMPLQLYQSPRDGLVPYENTVEASEAFKQHGSNVGVVPMFHIPMGSIVPMPMPNRAHVEAGIPCILAAYSWFSVYRFKQQLGVLDVGNFMLYGQAVTSENRQYSLNYQCDGNLALYRKTDGTLLWQAGIVANRVHSGRSLCVVPDTSQPRFIAYQLSHDATQNVENAGICILQRENGMLAIYNNQGIRLWTTETTISADKLIVNNDGILVIQNKQGAVVWQLTT